MKRFIFAITVVYAFLVTLFSASLAKGLLIYKYSETGREIINYYSECPTATCYKIKGVAQMINDNSDIIKNEMEAARH